MLYRISLIGILTAGLLGLLLWHTANMSAQRSNNSLIDQPLLIISESSAAEYMDEEAARYDADHALPCPSTLPFMTNP